MKTDLATTIFTGIIGIIAAYFICDLILPNLEDVKIKTINAESAYTLIDPDPEIFNFRAVNPTVEVYVGECTEYDDNGKCLDDSEHLNNSEQSETWGQSGLDEGGQNGYSD